MFVKPIYSTVTDVSELINIIYLPPLGSIATSEPFIYPALRKSYMGRGEVGRILRNILLDLKRSHERLYHELKGSKNKISGGAMKRLKKKSSWHRLRSILASTFGYTIELGNFDENFHTYIPAYTRKAEYDPSNDTVRIAKGTPKLELSVQGSGFQQWMSIFAVALLPGIDVILLDEPDAHLHSSLQMHLLQNLSKICADYSKKAIIATHSRDLIINTPFEHIVYLSSDLRLTRLSSDMEKSIVLAGVGSPFFGEIERLAAAECVVMVEGKEDTNILSKFYEAIFGADPKQDGVEFLQFEKDMYRRDVFAKHFCDLVRGRRTIKFISIVDRDDIHVNSVDASNLMFKDRKYKNCEMYMWRRRDIEAYLINCNVISRVSRNGSSADEIKRWILEKWGVNIDADNSKGVIQTLCKEMLNDICRKFNVRKTDIIEHFRPDEIHHDIRVILDRIRQLCQKTSSS